MNTQKEYRSGEAYAFFYYPGSKDEIVEALPEIMLKDPTQPRASLEVISGLDNLDTQGDSALVDIVGKAKSSHMSHVIKATLPGKTNKQTADALSYVMNGVYMQLYSQSEPFCGEVVYKRGEKYVFKRD